MEAANDERFPSSLDDLNSTPIIQRDGLEPRGEGHNAQPEDIVHLPTRDLLQDYNTDLHAVDENGFSIASALALAESSLGPLDRYDFGTGTAEEYSQFLQSIGERAQLFAGINDDGELQAKDQVRTFSEFLVYRREVLQAPDQGLQRLRGANWTKETALLYQWSVFCATRKLQAQMALAKFNALMIGSDPTGTEFRENRVAVSNWEGELRRADEQLSAA